MMAEKFLERIGYTGSTRVCPDTLRALQRQHLTAVPYENLDMLHKVPLRFDTQSLWDKIVAHRRGGVCWELNFLFGEMLRRLGFEVDYLSGVVAGGAGGDFSHALLLVRFPEGNWIADVGFATGYRYPFRLEEGWQSDTRYDYRLRPEGEWWALERKDPEQGVREEYRFQLKPRQKADYREMQDFLCTSPTCKFTYTLVCTLEPPEGRLTLRDNILQLARPGQPPERTELPDLDEVNRALRDRFGISETW